MIRKIFSLLLALSVVLTMVACGDDRSDRDDRDEQAGNDAFGFPGEDGSLDFADDEASKDAEPAMSYEDQIALIVREKAQWQIDADEYYMDYSYTVTDLDRNGRLELIVAACMGTGYFTYSYIWQVNETLDGIEQCQVHDSEYGAQSDLIVSQAKAYADGDRFCYIFRDYMRSGWAWNGETTYAFCLRDGVITEEVLASYSCNNYDDGSSDTTYFDADGNEISEEEYDEAASEAFSGADVAEADFLWQMLSSDEFSQLDDEGLIRLLQTAWDGFTVG